MARRAFLLGALCAAGAGAPVRASEGVEPSITVSGIAEAMDGDGLAMGPVPIRLHGIDAPESGQECSRAGGGTGACDEAALDHLAGLVDGKRVACTVLERDPYRRLVSRCRAGDTDISESLVRDGLA